MEFVIIYWDESDNIHLLKDRHQETVKFLSKRAAEIRAIRNEISKYKVVNVYV